MQVTGDVVTSCFEFLLERTPAETEVDYFVHVSREAGWRRRDLVAAIASSLEFRLVHGLSPQKDLFEDLAEVEYRGLSYLLPKDDFSNLSLRDPRGYEPYVSDHLFPRLKEGDVFVDVGANLGLFALPAAKAVGAGGLVIAFEAAPDNANLLARNAVRNKVGNVRILPVGLGDYNGSTTSPKAHSSDRNLLPPGAALAEGVDVMPVVRMDSFLDADARVDVLKIDVEGYEYRVFKGAASTVARCRPLVYMEYSSRFQMSGSGVPGAALIDMLSGLGYGFTILHRDRPPERVTSDSPAAYVDDAVAAAEAGGVSHLDLFLEPAPR